MTTIGEVAALLDDRDPESRRRGAQLIGHVAGPVAAALLLRALGDADWRVRKEAAGIASSVEPRTLVIERLLEAVKDRENVGLRNACVEALVALGRDAVTPVVNTLVLADADTRKLLVELLGGIPDLRGTRALAGALRDEDVNVRATAAEALGSAALAGEDARALAVGALTGTLRPTNAPAEPLLRLAALNSLGRLEAALAWETFEPLTHDPLLRRHAIAAASRSREPAAVEALAGAIGHASVGVARDSLVALVECLTATGAPGELRTVARDTILRTETATERVRAFARSNEDPFARGAALVVLGLLRMPADVPELVRGLAGGDVTEQAELGLAWFGEDAVAALVAEGTASSPAVRKAALSLLPHLATNADEATLEALREALQSTSAEVVTAALQSLAIIGDASDLARVGPHATSKDPRIAATASAALTTLAGRHVAEARVLADTVSPDAKDAVVGCLLRGASAAPPPPGEDDRQVRSPDEAANISFLRGALDHRDVHVRRAAVDALGAIGGSTAAVVVARALADEERDVVLAAVRALGSLGQVERLLALLDGVTDAVVIAAALRALGEANPERAFEAARPLLFSKDPLLAASAVEAIGQLRGVRRDHELFPALDHPHPDVVKSALVELSRDMSPETLAQVGRCLDHPSYEVRRFAADLLVSQKGGEAHALVRARMDREPDPVIREALGLALALAVRPTRVEP